jgi:hypothetical protein
MNAFEKYVYYNFSLFLNVYAWKHLFALRLNTNLQAV